MNRLVGTLLVAALIQCSVVAALYWPITQVPGEAAGEHLTQFDLTKADEIYVVNERGDEAVLLKMGSRWLLPDLQGMPADTDMVEKLYAGIGDRAAHWPIATTDSSRQRFQVASYRHRRRLTFLANGEELGTIYLGTSPGFRHVYARNAVRDAIYRIPYNVHDAPARVERWLDKTLLQISAPTEIRADDITLTTEQGRWTTADGRNADSGKLTALLLGLGGLQVSGLADEDAQRTLAIAAPDLTLEVESPERHSRLRLYTLGERHFIRSDRYDYYFSISAHDFDRLLHIGSAGGRRSQGQDSGV